MASVPRRTEASSEADEATDDAEFYTSVGAPSRERVLACRDASTLESWIDRAATATSAVEVFADGDR